MEKRAKGRKILGLEVSKEAQKLMKKELEWIEGNQKQEEQNQKQELKILIIMKNSNIKGLKKELNIDVRNG